MGTELERDRRREGARADLGIAGEQAARADRWIADEQQLMQIARWSSWAWAPRSSRGEGRGAGGQELVKHANRGQARPIAGAAAVRGITCAESTPAWRISCADYGRSLIASGSIGLASSVLL
jgi:hypothetical protein